MRPIEAVARQFGVTQSDFRDERPQSVPQWQQCIPQWQQSVAQCCGMRSVAISGADLGGEQTGQHEERENQGESDGDRADEAEVANHRHRREQQHHEAADRRSSGHQQGCSSRRIHLAHRIPGSQPSIPIHFKSTPDVNRVIDAQPDCQRCDHDGQHIPVDAEDRHCTDNP